MRDLKSLLESQVVDKNTINRALELNETIATLREENASLRRENQRHKETEQELADELESQEEALVASEHETLRVKEELKRQQVSLDCVYNDLEESRKVIARLRQELSEKNSETQPNLINSLRKEESQAKFLVSAVEKTSHSNGSFFSSFGGANTALERKISSLETENTKLKSDLVRLQTRYREEAYLNRKNIEALQESSTAVTASLDNSQELHESSDSSTSDEGDHEERQTISRAKSFRRGLQEHHIPSTKGVHVVPCELTVQVPHETDTLHSTEDTMPPLPSPQPPRRIQSIRPDKCSMDTPTTAVRRIQSYQPSSERTQFDFLEDEINSQGSMQFELSQSIRKLGWWYGGSR